MAKVVKNTLGYLGIDYQYRLVSAFIDDAEFFKTIHSIVDPNMFTDAYLRTIVGVMSEYIHKWEVVPSYDTILIKLKQKSLNDDEIQFYEETIEKLRKTTTEAIEDTEEMAWKFFKQQKLVLAANTIKQIAGDGDMEQYDACMEIVESALAVGKKKSNRSTPFESIDDDLSKEAVTTIPTGVAKLDECLGGGLDKGKVGIIIGSMGFGKTSMTTCLAGNAATHRCEQNNYEGYKVLQIVFEDKPRDIHRKYMSKVTGIETCKLNENAETTQKVKEILANSPQTELINNNIMVMRLDTGEVSATDIKNTIKQTINEGFKPDMVIVDYFECIAPEKAYGSERDDQNVKEGKTMRKFENMADELDIAMWIPVQGNRDSISAELVTNDKIGGSIKKNQIAQVVISITRSVDDVKNQKATLAVLKNRSGSAGIVLQGILFDNGTCTISSEGVVDFDDVLQYNEYATERESEIRDEMGKELRNARKLHNNLEYSDDDWQ